MEWLAWLVAIGVALVLLAPAGALVYVILCEVASSVPDWLLPVRGRWKRPFLVAAALYSALVLAWLYPVARELLLGALLLGVASGAMLLIAVLPLLMLEGAVRLHDALVRRRTPGTVPQRSEPEA